MQQELHALAFQQRMRSPSLATVAVLVLLMLPMPKLSSTSADLLRRNRSSTAARRMLRSLYNLLWQLMVAAEVAADTQAGLKMVPGLRLTTVRAWREVVVMTPHKSSSGRMWGCS